LKYARFLVTGKSSRSEDLSIEAEFSAHCHPEPPKDGRRTSA
jgi:hypothetical protein